VVDGLRGVDDEDVGPRAPRDLLRHRAEEPAGEARDTLVAHHDEIGLVQVGLGADGVGGVAPHGDGVDGAGPARRAWSRAFRRVSSAGVAPTIL